MRRAPGRVIDLAPGHKLGLVVENPVLLGAGSVGLGADLHPELDLRALGAVVVGPLTLQSRAGVGMPRLAALPGAAVLATGAQNRGLEATLRAAGALWARLGVPVVVQVAEWQPEALRRLAERLARVRGVAALELLAPADGDVAHLRRLVELLAMVGELPVWVKLACGAGPGVQAAAQAAATGGAAALVVAQAPAGVAAARGGIPVYGALLGPAACALMMQALADVVAAGTGLPLIAAGGVHGEAQARAALAAGAAAVQLDAVAWIEPTLPGLIARRLAEGAL